jgi:hypothetical protein
MAKKYYLPLVLFVYAVGFVLLYPAYRYIFDHDGIGYMTVTKKLVAGDWLHGINGFWPPLHSWLAIPFYKAGMDDLTAFKTLNGLIGAGIFISVNRLMIKAGIQPTWRLIALFVCIPVVLSYVFNELAADILLCFLLLVYTDIVSAPDFFENRKKNIAAGMVGCLCYLAKTYALPFFVLHFVIMQWMLYKRSGNKRMFISNLLAGLGACFLLALPWIIVLYNRYGFVTLGHVFIFGRSGQFNLSYYLHPEEYTSPELILAPPAGLCCYWANPLFQLTQQPHYYSSLFSFSMIVDRIRTLLYNFIVALKLLHGFSFLSGAIIVGQGLYIIQKKDGFLSQLLLMILVFPVGYLLLHVESRFLWPLTFLILIAGLVLANKLVQLVPVKKSIRILFWSLFFASFLISPLDNLKDWRYRNKETFELVAELNAKGIQGRFLGENYAGLPLVAYLTDSYNYFPGRADYRYSDLLQAARQQHIDYYFYYYSNTQQLEAFRQTVFYKNALQEIPVKMPNLLLLKMN